MLKRRLFNQITKQPMKKKTKTTKYTIMTNTTSHGTLARCKLRYTINDKPISALFYP